SVQQVVAGWEHHRNQAKATMNWQFTIDKARDKLDRLYPS
ncbi:MAG TPA: IS630 family transposase, partial [Herpetosiphonaceae bacterium]|nr:IS630 family transposase [Herpetosiphonaceae bacterium]